MKSRIKTLLALISVIGLGFLAGVASYSGLIVNRAPAGSHIGELEIGGYTQEQAIALVKWFDGVIQRREITVVSDGTERKVAGREIGVSVDIEQVRSELKKELRSRPLWPRVRSSLGFIDEPWEIDLPIVYDETKLDQACASVVSAFERKPVSASYDFQTRSFTPEVTGVKVDSAALRDAIIREFGRLEPGVVQVKTEVQRPAITLDRLREMGLTAVVSSFSTRFDQQDKARSHNIALAASLINGTLLKPGQTFSFNERVGPRTTSLGFQEAKEIVNNEYVIGIGGGVCQVSSTLYNAALMAGMTIVERRPHSKTISYISPGRDATVYFNAIDFRFRNDLNYPVLIVSQVVGGRLYAGVVSSPAFGLDVRISTTQVSRTEPEISKVPDPTLPVGEEVVEQQPTPGLVVETRRRIYAGGVLTVDEVVSKDTYQPTDGIIRVGTGT